MAKTVYLPDAMRRKEYEEFMSLLNSSIHCVERCDPAMFPYTKAVLNIVSSDHQLQQGLLVLLRNFKVAVEENYQMKQQLRE
ncbi:MAG: hypothetical protein IJ550_02155 [Bacteroidaceae bacterium]|nr:hypothetical protein [Bacteroidaceae bacterium]